VPKEDISEQTNPSVGVASAQVGKFARVTLLIRQRCGHRSDPNIGRTISDNIVKLELALPPI
jgi:hypothetical protein